MKIPHNQWGFHAFMKAKDIKEIEDKLRRHRMAQQRMKRWKKDQAKKNQG